MRVLVVRHAIAEDRDAFAPSGRPDAERPLTGDGRRKMAEAALGLKRMVDRLDLIATSPLVRARDTAAIVAHAFEGPKLVEEPSLAPGVGPAAVLEWLRHRPRDAVVALVGHEPDLSELIGLLVAGEAGSAVELKKGAACLLDFAARPEAGNATIVWLLPPKALRSLGASAGA